MCASLSRAARSRAQSEIHLQRLSNHTLTNLPRPSPIPCAVIIDGVNWNAKLPLSIDAFIAGTVGSEGAQQAATAHKAFLKFYGLTAVEVPLVETTGSAYTPFREAMGR